MNWNVVCLICAKCHTKNYFIYDLNDACIRCSKCSTVFENVELFNAKGFVYLLSNRFMPGILKIESTENSVPERVSDLSSPTGIPHPFEIEAYFWSLDPKKDEFLIHSELSAFRLPNREFFSISIDACLQVICQVLKRDPVFLKRGVNYLSESSKNTTLRKHICENCGCIFTLRPGVFKCPFCESTLDQTRFQSPKIDEWQHDHWENRRLCDDGNCIGVIGPDGKCKECGK